ncbi:ABC1-domain-containing protein [Multifurca ochricompacta]|uniref:ABC1-domain-containing protein n=1 Tax=Multifurca ochricompacta TaxID=376703 RepID=A0AAD4M2V1_9AGAM|nr:ABC1-domain-containing protein [Multifurca ochricompacta]
MRYIFRSPAIRSYHLLSHLPSSRQGSPRSYHALLTPSSSRQTLSAKGVLVRRLGYVVLLGVVGYVADRELYASTMVRNLRTFWTCALIAADYKLNFTPGKSDSISALHERVGDRLLNLFLSNGGLYIKFGQVIGANAALLPRPIQVKFSRLFDDAPQVPFIDIARVFQEEFGRPPSGPDGIFLEFEETAVASASIAQVHRARLKGEDGRPGDWVAVKVQKPAVAKQMEPDLAAFRAAMWIYEHWVFDMPAYFVVDFICDHLHLIAQDLSLAERVHIPNVHPEYSTKRVLTAEWIGGVRLSDRQGVLKLMGNPSADLPSKSMTPLGSPALSAQIFRWGWVHCDPHPGNIFIRPHPQHRRRPQLVLIDHGLYVELAPQFRRQYAELWKALIAIDLGTISRVATQWGLGEPGLFASSILLKPISLSTRSKKPDNKESTTPSQYEASVLLKEKLRNFLVDTDKMPKELIFVGRNMRIVQGNNQMLGSPVNRIKIIGLAAADAIPRSSDLSFGSHIKERFHEGMFYAVMASIEAVFWLSHTWKWITGSEDDHFEDELDRQMREVAKTQYGIDIDPAAYDA